jgi:hypothetical protein
MIEKSNWAIVINERTSTRALEERRFLSQTASVRHFTKRGRWNLVVA